MSGTAEPMDLPASVQRAGGGRANGQVNDQVNDHVNRRLAPKPEYSPPAPEWPPPRSAYALPFPCPAPGRSLYAALHKILPLPADDLLIDRPFKTVKMGLCHAELHLIALLLTFHPLRRGLTGKSFAARDRLRSSGIDRNSGGRRGGLRKCSDRQGERAGCDEGAQ